MVRASGVDVTLWLASVPVLDGARETVAAGVFSSLQPQNVRLRRAVRNLEAASEHPDFPLLFDPQTAGGLLAAVPEAEAASCVAALQASGYGAAAIIGRVEPRTEAQEPIVVDLQVATRVRARDAVSRHSESKVVSSKGRAVDAHESVQ
jgi:selenide, water dikinase